MTTASILALAPIASAETETILPSQGDSIVEDTTPTPLVTRPRDVMVWTDVDPSLVTPAVNTNKIFLNNCKPNGCVVRSGQTSSIDGTGFQGSWGISGTRTLTPFAASDTVWQQTVDCLREVFSPFAVEITTVNPSPAPHFEIMIAGAPGDLGMSSGIGGVSPFSCAPYIPNSLVFDFQKVWGTDVEEICSTAAQEIAHSFALDHVIDPSDPLTYFNFNGRRRFKDAQIQCGSDCQGGQSPFGDTCTGSTQQIHSCSCPNGSTILTPTQNSVATMKALFGSGTPTPPVVKITEPKLGAIVQAGFPVRADITDDNGVSRAEMYVDNMLFQTVMAAPYAFNAPASLGNGTHTVKVIGFDIYGTSATASVQVVIGKPCGGDGDCPTDTDVCLGGRCVAGPEATGGLGAECMSSVNCAGGECQGDATGEKHCVESCVLGEGQCPDGFGCLEAGADKGVCWPGFDDGTGGCCSANSDPAGPMVLGAMVCGMLVLRRRRRR
ncbi:MAG: Ig-like domain-containing protein [Polyangiales bacterium]